MRVGSTILTTTGPELPDREKSRKIFGGSRA